MMPAPAPSRPRSPSRPTVAIPPELLIHLRRSLRKEVGPLAATHVLQDAGFATGEAIYNEFSTEAGVDPTDLTQDEFWSVLGEYFRARGWGRLEADRVHSGLGRIHAFDWAESRGDGQDEQPGCHFSSGMFAYILSQAAGAAIAVLEVRCRSQGDDRCTFLYGSEAAVHEMYGLLLEGTSLENALVQL
jgi:predicted hydrocarbon binding protein